jgi:hypothetical protein
MKEDYWAVFKLSMQCKEKVETLLFCSFANALLNFVFCYCRHHCSHGCFTARTSMIHPDVIQTDVTVLLHYLVIIIIIIIKIIAI